MMILAALALAGTISTEDLRKEFPVAPHDQAIVDDAIARWIKKNSSNTDAMAYRIPIVLDLPRERCVVLQLRAVAIGGTPVYCYALREDVLVEADDDVE